MYDRKECMKLYRLEHKEEIKQSRQQYAKKARRMKYVGYGGVCFCPRCGKKGYKHFHKTINILTGHEHPVFTIVIHQHSEHGKTVYDGCCYVGVGKL